jgi:hypothetical protein
VLFSVVTQLGATLDALSVLSLPPSLAASLRVRVYTYLTSAADESLPVVVRHLLSTISVGDRTAARETLSEIRSKLSFDFDSAARAVGRVDAEERGVAALCLAEIRSAAQFNPSLATEFVRMMSDTPCVLDVWMSLALYTVSGCQRAVQRAVKKCVSSGVWTRVLLRDSLGTHERASVCAQYSGAARALANWLLRVCDSVVGRQFAADMYEMLFFNIPDASHRQDVVGALMGHVGSPLTAESTAALRVLDVISQRDTAALRPYAVFVKSALDFVVGQTNAQVRMLMRVMARLVTDDTRGNSAHARQSETDALAAELFIFLRKLLTNAILKYNRIGIIGALEVLRACCRVNETDVEYANAGAQSGGRTKKQQQRRRRRRKSDRNDDDDDDDDDDNGAANAFGGAGAAASLGMSANSNTGSSNSVGQMGEILKLLSNSTYSSAACHQFLLDELASLIASVNTERHRAAGNGGGGGGGSEMSPSAGLSLVFLEEIHRRFVESFLAQHVVTIESSSSVLTGSVDGMAVSAWGELDVDSLITVSVFPRIAAAGAEVDLCTRLPSAFRLLAEYERYSAEGGSLTTIDATLGCSVVMFDRALTTEIPLLSYSQRNAIAQSLWTTLGWARELLNAFADETREEFLYKVLMRVRWCVEIEEMLVRVLAHMPEWTPRGAETSAELCGIVLPEHGAKKLPFMRKNAAAATTTAAAAAAAVPRALGAPAVPVNVAAHVEKASSESMDVEAMISPAPPAAAAAVAAAGGSQANADEAQSAAASTQPAIGLDALERLSVLQRPFSLRVVRLLVHTDEYQPVDTAASASVYDTDGETISLTREPKLLRFLLRELDAKLTHALTPSAVKTPAMSEASDVSCEDVVREVLLILPGLCAHLENLSEVLQTTRKRLAAGEPAASENGSDRATNGQASAVAAASAAQTQADHVESDSDDSSALGSINDDNDDDDDDDDDDDAGGGFDVEDSATPERHVKSRERTAKTKKQQQRKATALERQPESNSAATAREKRAQAAAERKAAAAAASLASKLSQREAIAVECSSLILRVFASLLGAPMWRDPTYTRLLASILDAFIARTNDVIPGQPLPEKCADAFTYVSNFGDSLVSLDATTPYLDCLEALLLRAGEPIGYANTLQRPTLMSPLRKKIAASADGFLRRVWRVGVPRRKDLIRRLLITRISYASKPIHVVKYLANTVIPEIIQDRVCEAYPL